MLNGPHWYIIHEIAVNSFHQNQFLTKNFGSEAL